MRLPSNLASHRAAWRALAAAEPRTTPCFRVENAGDTPKFYVYDLIGGWDNDAAEFVQAVHAVKADAIDVHVNSPGGFVYDGMAMYEALRGHPAAVAVHIDGLAASAASFLAQAGDTIDISPGGRVMIHDAQGVGIGSPADLREFADLLDGVSDDIAGIYAGRTGGKAADWRAAMTATTWYSAQQSVDAGLVDRVTGKTSGPDNRTRLIQARHRALVPMEG